MSPGFPKIDSASLSTSCVAGTAPRPGSGPEVLRSVSARLAAEEDVLVEGLMETLLNAFPEIRDDSQAVHRLRVSLQANVSTLIALMDHSVNIDLVEPPAGAIQFAHYLAHQRVPMSTLWRIYHIATAKFVDQCLCEMFAAGCDASLVAEQTTAISALIHEYVDRVCIRIGQTYDTERERWLRGLDIKRTEKVSELLSGRPVDISKAEQALGYRIRNRDHIAVVLWDTTPELSAYDSSLNALQQGVLRCSELLQCPEAPLWLARSTTTAWAWFPLLKAGRKDRSGSILIDPDAIPANVRVAVGEPHPDEAGFVRTHRQATLAHSVSLAADTTASRVIPYRSVGGLSFLCRDLDGARKWVDDTIGPLAADTDSAARIRETLQTYLACSGSLSAAARQLGCHKNTVAYRVHKAQDMLGRGLETRRVDVIFALHACQWLRPVRSRPD